nr:hypothetical protein GCM10020063_055030 [Dactylosporangium thailandense]
MTRRRAQLTMAGLLALLSLCAGGAAATDLVHYATGERGTITVRACTADHGARKVSYDCTGTFTAAGGGAPHEAEFAESFARSPGDTVPATRNGGTVNEVSPAATATGLLIAAASLAGVVVFLLLARRRPATSGDRP